MKCTYCGVGDAEQRDHVVPYSFVRIPSKRRARGPRRSDSVPACFECNSLLSNRPFFTIGSRAGYLAKAIERKYRRILKMPAWSENELAETSDSFQSHIRGCEMAKILIQERISHCSIIEVADLSIKDVWGGRPRKPPVAPTEPSAPDWADGLRAGFCESRRGMPHR